MASATLLQLLVLVTSLVTLVTGNKNYTVTCEATLELEVKNYNGQGDDINHKLVIGLFGDTAPVTSLNFRKLCDGWKKNDQKLTFKSTTCHRLVKDLLLQCGDITTGDGTGSISIYGHRFNDENFDISHSSGGIVSMANHGTDTNGSQFFILFGPSRFLNGKHVAFGKVIKGFNVLRTLNKMGPKEDGNDSPRRTVRIADCYTEEVKKYELSTKDFQRDDLEEGK